MNRSRNPASERTRAPAPPRNAARRRLAALATSLALLPLPGCSHLTTSIGPELPPRQTLPLAVGASTLGDVVRTLGPPAQISTLTAGGCTMLYEHNSVVENQIGFSVPYQALKFFKFVYAHADIDHHCWIMTFDAHGNLTAWGDQQATKPYGSGFAMQFLFVAEELVDTSKVTRPAPQHAWGWAALDPLPKALNDAQSLTSGTRGLEQSLTPEHVGQRALEMPSKQDDAGKQ